MAGGRASGPIDETTFGGRLRAARLASPYDAQQLAEAIGKASAQSIYDYENPNKSDSPTPEALGILAKKTGESLDWLVYAVKPDQPESPFMKTMRAFEDDLDRISQRVMGKVAAVEVEETKMRRAASTLSLSPEQAELLLATQEMTPDQLRALIGQVRQLTQPAPSQESQGTEDQPQTRRRESRA